jgi:hypothetical protein
LRSIFCISLAVDWLDLIFDLLSEAFWEFLNFAIAEAFRDDRPSFPKDISNSAHAIVQPVESGFGPFFPRRSKQIISAHCLCVVGVLQL